MQKPRFEYSKTRHFIGQSLSMSLVNNRTRELWSVFKPQLSKIKDRVGGDFFNLQVYPDGYHENFDPSNEFLAYALVEVSESFALPKGMQAFELPAGDYAVFIHKGGPKTAAATAHYIFEQWLPHSGYRLDHRPHFEVIGSKYKANDPDSEEEFWVPLKSI